MYRVYLADDNDLFRDSLIKTIQWDKIGCILVGNSRDGNTAGREIMELLPDIVLMDIRMPGMSGLEIAALLRSEGFKGRVIIITGYSDFGYAQKSIRIGVFDYLLKPVDEHELENVIIRAGEDIERKLEGSAEQVGKTESGGVFSVDCEGKRQDLDLLLQKGLNGDTVALEEMESAVSSQMCFTLYELLRISPDNPGGLEGSSMEKWTQAVRDLFREIPEGMSVCSSIHGKALYVLVYFRKFEVAKDYDIETIIDQQILYTCLCQIKFAWFLHGVVSGITIRTPTSSHSVYRFQSV